MDTVSTNWDNIDWDEDEILRINPITGEQWVERLWPETKTSVSDRLVIAYAGALTILVLQAVLRILLSSPQPAIPPGFDLLLPSFTTAPFA